MNKDEITDVGVEIGKKLSTNVPGMLIVAIVSVSIVAIGGFIMLEELKLIMECKP